MGSVSELMDRGIACLVDQLGVVDAEQFIAIMKRDDFDYTVWQREYFDKMASEEFMQNAADYADSHPYKGKATVIY